jgi:hypothetical protein
MGNSERSKKLARVAKGVEEMGEPFSDRTRMKQKAYLHIALQGSFGKICGRYKDVPTIRHHTFGMKRSTFGAIGG